MSWTLDNDRPIYLQLMERIQRDIIAGVYQPGDKLPSVRDLALEAAVNPNTMQKALSELERSGLVYSQRTSGRFITEDTEMLTQMKRTCNRTYSRIFSEDGAARLFTCRAAYFSNKSSRGGELDGSNITMSVFNKRIQSFSCTF